MKLNILVLMVLGSIFIFSCNNESGVTDPNSNAPQINELTTSPDSVYQGESSTISCIANDPARSTLTYFWASTAGDFSGSGSSITWNAPDTTGIFTITCKVENAAGMASSQKVDVHVVQPDIPEQGLIAYYPFLNSINDISDNNFDGQIAGNASTNGFLTINHNETDYVSLPHNVLDGLQDFTVSAWVSINTLTSDANVLINGINGNTSFAFVFFYASSLEQWGIYINNTTQFFDQNMVVEDLKWHHVTVLRSGAVSRLYLNGNEVGNGITVDANPLNIDANSLVLGQYIPGPYVRTSWAGNVDNLIIYNRALSESEIQKLYDIPHSN